MCSDPACGRQGRFLTTAEAARQLSISERHCRRLIKAGKIPATKLAPGGPWRVPDFFLDSEFMMRHMAWTFERYIQAGQRTAGRETSIQDDPERQRYVLEQVLGKEAADAAERSGLIGA